MMMFWVILGILTIIAVFFAVVPLFKSKQIKELSRDEQNIAIAQSRLASLQKQLNAQEIDQDEFNAAKQELENSLAIDLENEDKKDFQKGGTWLIYVLLVFIPVVSGLLYWHWGQPNLLNPQQKLAELQKAQQAQAQSIENMSIEDMIAAVKKRLTEDPKDGEGWFMLGRTFMAIQKYDEAVTAYRRSYELIGENATIMLSLADAIAMTQQGSMQGEPKALVDAAIVIEPENSVGLWLAGLAAEQSGLIEQAYTLWSRLLPMLEEDPASQQELKVMLVKLKKEHPEFAALPFDDSKIIDKRLTVQVALDEAIKAQLTGNEQVFIYAKAVSGPPMPLAAKKMSVADLPVSVVLSDADAMLPQMKLSGFDTVTVGARISLSGNPIAQSGDYFAEISPVDINNAATPLVLTINRKIP